MQINKFKKRGKNKYEILFDNETILLYEDVILKYNLLIKKNIDEHLLDEIISENSYYEAYDKALSYIDVKLRTKKEIEEYLSKKGFDSKYIEYSIKKINDLGLLNDELYAKSYINDKINLTLDGPYKIKNDLLNLNIDENIINKYLNEFNDIWKDRMDKIINKKKKIMKEKSYFMYVNKLKSELYSKGYYENDINEKLSNISYESNAIEKDIDKAIRKYKNDKNKIINYLLRKGYSYDEIKNNIREVNYE